VGRAYLEAGRLQETEEHLHQPLRRFAHFSTAARRRGARVQRAARSELGL